ncbi:CpsD/CapB family tyrosine-protein kinase [Clostridium sp.]|uniref:CpsD/CapB family tyrosine-protein kinase n=1 Tax=Clostridium sp. TaxID=1506 RepID=UPI0032162EBF
MHIVEKEPKSIVAESYRTLRTNLQYSSFDGDYKVIVITSSNPSEGKSTVAGNLALSLAKGDKKVILIDCDLRKPALHKRFKLSNVTGLSDIILAKERSVVVGQRYNENLIVITVGTIPPNPSEMLGSKYMANLIEALKKLYDYVILDTPPIQLVTDAQVLSAKADGTILVIRAEETKKSSVHNAIDLLRKVNANIIGIVLNGVDIKESNNYYYSDTDK